MAQPTLLFHIRQLIARDELPKALSQLRTLLENTPMLNDILQQSGRLSHIRRKMRRGTVTEEDAAVEENRIRFNVLELLSEMEQETLPSATLSELLSAVEEESTRPELKKEWEKAVSVVNSKNVVMDSTLTAGGDIHIGDRIQQIIAPSKHPRQLTTIGATVPGNFMGRERELFEIRERFHAGRTALALVNAEGGMGKTTLAAAFWKRFSDDYQHLAWLFCANGILNAMRNQLPEPLGLREKMNEVADDIDQQIRLIVTSMANLPQNCLLVLDNANEPEHIKDFERHCAGLGWHVIITSRCSGVMTDPEAEHPIRSLPPDEAARLFRSNYDEKTLEFEALLHRFLLAVGYNTLCIEVFSKTLHEGSEGWSDLNFKKLLQQLESNGLKLGADSFEIKTNWAQNLQNNAANSDQIIEALYRVSSLKPEAGELLARFCLLPAASHNADVLIPLLAPDDKKGLKRGLDQLAQKGWLSIETKTYRVSSVVQKIVLRHYTDHLWELGKDTVARLNVIFETEGNHPKNIATAGAFAELVPGLVDNIGVANKDLAMLFDRLWVYHTAKGDLAQALQTAEKMRVLCGKFGFKNGLAISYANLGETHTASGNLPKALTFFEEFNRLENELHEAYPQNVSFKNSLAISHSKLGATHTALGNLPKALTFFEEFNRLENELYEAYPQKVSFKNNLAISYANLGSTHTALGNLPKALTFFEKDIELSKELHEAYPQNAEFKNGLAVSYQYFGYTHTALGNLPKALTFFEEYNRLENELHEAYPQNVDFKNRLAASYLLLGQFYKNNLNDPETATMFIQKGYDLYAQLVNDFPDYQSFRNNYVWAKEEFGL